MQFIIVNTKGDLEKHTETVENYLKAGWILLVTGQYLQEILHEEKKGSGQASGKIEVTSIPVFYTHLTKKRPPFER